MLGASVDRASLNVGDKLGVGGTATVFRATVPVHGDVAFKEYRTGRGVDADVRPDDDSVADLIDVVAGMGSAERAAWLERFAWPLSVVTSGDAVVGNLMPMAPERFYVDYTTGSGARQRTKRRFADMQLLLNSPDFLANRGIVVTGRQQLELLRSAAEGFATLHAKRIVIGDVSAKNLVFDASGAESSVYFIDCDAMTDVSGAGDGKHVETADWTVPVAPDGSREPLNTMATDAYKFGLLVLRLLTGKQNGRDSSTLPDEVGSLRPLLARSLSADPAVRPLPGDWVPSLTVAMKHAQGPAIGTATADRGTTPPDAPSGDESVFRAAQPASGQIVVPVPMSVAVASVQEFFKRLGHLAALASNGYGVAKPADAGVEATGGWVVYDRINAQSLASFRSVPDSRRRFAMKLAATFDAAADLGVQHAGLSDGQVLVQFQRGSEHEPLVLGFEQVPQTLGRGRPPGFDEIVAALLLANDGYDDQRTAAFRIADRRPELNCVDYVRYLADRFESIVEPTSAQLGYPNLGAANFLAPSRMSLDAARTQIGEIWAKLGRRAKWATVVMVVTAIAGAYLLSGMNQLQQASLLDRDNDAIMAMRIGAYACFAVLIFAYFVRRGSKRQQAAVKIISAANSVLKAPGVELALVSTAGDGVDAYVRTDAAFLKLAERQRFAAYIKGELEVDHVYVYARGEGGTPRLGDPLSSLVGEHNS